MKERINRIINQLSTFDHCRMTWAMRSTLAAIMALFATYLIPSQRLILVISVVVFVQIFSCFSSRFSKFYLLLIAIILSVLVVAVGVASQSLLSSWLCIVLSIMVAFYFGYKGVTVAFGLLWAMVLVVVNACMPIAPSQLLTQFSALMLALGLAIIMLYLKLPRRKADKLSAVLQLAIFNMQRYMSEVFNQILVEQKTVKHYSCYRNVRSSLQQLRTMIDFTNHSYLLKTQEITDSVREFSYYYATIFHIIISIDRMCVASLPNEAKLGFEHLNLSLQSLTDLLHQLFDTTQATRNTVDNTQWEKTTETLDYTLSQVSRYIENEDLSNDSCLMLSGFYYLLEKLADEFHAFFELISELEKTSILQKIKEL
jgi:hypothetical protein